MLQSCGSGVAMRHDCFETRNTAPSRLPIFRGFLVIVSILSFVDCYHSTSSSSSTARPQLVATLQSCYTSQQLLDRVGRHVTTHVDPDGSLASLVWVRLCKLLVHESNQWRWRNNGRGDATAAAASLSQYSCLNDAHSILEALALQMSDRRPGCLTGMSTEAAVDLTKAAGVCSRILSTSVSSDLYRPIAEFWENRAQRQSRTPDSDWETHQLSGLKWAYDSLSVGLPYFKFPDIWNEQHAALDLPFQIIPGCISNEELSLTQLIAEVDFQLDEIRTKSNRTVPERRKTAWQGDDGVADFAYSGKSMSRREWSPVVETVRNRLHTASQEYYDCCLLNLYPDGESGMRYHIDPDQGTLWDYATTVVSVGSTRRFAFRSIPAHRPQGSQDPHPTPHTFHVLHGDATFMFGNCQTLYQHTVKKAEVKGDGTPRASLVFKRTWNDVPLPSRGK